MLKGLKIGTTNSGLKYTNRDDLLLISFDNLANVAGVFTTSSMPAAPVTWCKKSLKSGKAKALIVNAGNANAFTGQEGEEATARTAKKVAEALKCNSNEVFVSSTGVIGETLDVSVIEAEIPQLVRNFKTGEESWKKAAHAIMTTDTKIKLLSKTCKIGDETVTLVGFAKGSGMIAPNMATMLGYIFTDATISSKTLQILLKEANEQSFNSITVDSDQSTNDTVLLFATNAVENHEITDSHSSELADFKSALNELSLELAKKIVIDGEGAQKLVEIEVEGARTHEQAKQVAFSVANSPLVKTAIAAADPNWGRIIMAVGKSCDETSPEKIIIKIGDHPITKNGSKHPDYEEKLAHKHLTGSEVKVSINLGIGACRDVVWTCDLNEEYIKINKDYRS